MADEPLIFEDDDIRPLVVGIVFRAIADLKHKSLVRRLDALLWLCSDDFELFADVAGIPGANPFEILPRLGEVKNLLLSRSRWHDRRI